MWPRLGPFHSYGVCYLIAFLFQDLASQIHIGPLTLTQLVCLEAGFFSAAFLLWWRYRLQNQPAQPAHAA